jgi:hypothetical protein
VGIPLCVICKIKLDKIDEYIFKCPLCKNKYNIYQEIQEFQNEFGSSHDDSAAEIELAGLESAAGETLLLCAEDEFSKEEDNDTSKSDIKIPKYFRVSPTTKIIEYREE